MSPTTAAAFLSAIVKLRYHKRVPAASQLELVRIVCDESETLHARIVSTMLWAMSQLQIGLKLSWTSLATRVQRLCRQDLVAPTFRKLAISAWALSRCGHADRAWFRDVSHFIPTDGSDASSIAQMTWALVNAGVHDEATLMRLAAFAVQSIDSMRGELMAYGLRL